MSNSSATSPKPHIALTYAPLRGLLLRYLVGYALNKCRLCSSTAPMTKRSIKPALEPLEASSATHTDQIQPPGSADASITEVTPTFAVPPSPTSGKKRRASGPPQTTTSTTNASGLPAPADGLSISPPPVKKSRTNTPWSPAEEQRLKTMRDAGSSWSEIAKVRSIVSGGASGLSCSADSRL